MPSPRATRGRVAPAVAATLLAVVGGWGIASISNRPTNAASLVPPLVAVGLALWTKRVFLSLSAAVVAGGLLTLSAGAGSPFAAGLRGSGLPFAWQSLADRTNQFILLYVVLIMAMIAVMLGSGGIQAMASALARPARSARGARLTTLLAGLAVFLDDYANTMIVGPTMRPITDRHRVSREKLAFLVDATAAPVAGVAILSTWIGVEVGLLGEMSRKLDFGCDGYSIFFAALPFRFYCWTMLFFAAINSLLGIDFGPMRAAEQRARDEGKVLADDARPLVTGALSRTDAHPAARRLARTAVVPILLLLGVFLAGIWISGAGAARLAERPFDLLRLAAWRDALAAADSAAVLAVASAVGALAAAGWAVFSGRVPLGAVARAAAGGALASAMPVAVLVLAWSLKAACDQLGTGDYVASILGHHMPAWCFPAIVFVTAALTSLATGTSWGTMAILIPTALPVAARLDGGSLGATTILSAAAVLDGAIFGDHCSPISDTTIISSAASACDHVAHVRTQLPYSATVAVVVLVSGYLLGGAGVPAGAGLAASFAAVGAIFLVLWVARRGWRWPGS